MSKCWSMENHDLARPEVTKKNNNMRESRRIRYIHWGDNSFGKGITSSPTTAMFKIVKPLGRSLLSLKEIVNALFTQGLFLESKTYLGFK